MQPGLFHTIKNLYTLCVLKFRVLETIGVFGSVWHFEIIFNRRNLKHLNRNKQWYFYYMRIIYIMDILDFSFFLFSKQSLIKSILSSTVLNSVSNLILVPVISCRILLLSLTGTDLSGKASGELNCSNNSDTVRNDIFRLQ